MRSTLVLIGAFGLSTFTSVATATTACERLSTVHLDHAVVTWADPAITAQNTIRYYESVLQKMGPEQGNWYGYSCCPAWAIAAAVRASMGSIDARHRAVGGAGNRAKPARRPWCERTDPTPLSVSAGGGYSGSGDPKDGRNWSCKGEAPKGKP